MASVQQHAYNLTSQYQQGPPAHPHQTIPGQAQVKPHYLQTTVPSNNLSAMTDNSTPHQPTFRLLQNSSVTTPPLSTTPMQSTPATGPWPAPPTPLIKVPSTGGQPTPQPLPREAQPVQEIFGGNWLFVVFMPYFVATALQDTHLQIGLIVATAMSFTVLATGLLLFMLNLRKVFPHVLELIMPVIYVVQLGVSYISNSKKQEIIRTYPFITHSALAGVCVASMLVCYPVGYQTAQELVHKLYSTHPAVHRVGLYTTAVLSCFLVTSCLLYLAPLCKGFDDRHFNALNLIFRLIYPPLSTLLALLFMRFFPGIYLPNMTVVHGLNRKPPERMSAYMLGAMARRPPAILDASMYQSTVDAISKAREATTMGRAAMPHPSYMGSLHASPATPRYSPGADGYMEGLATAPAAQGMMPPLPYTSPGSAAAVAATSSLHPSHRGNQMLPAYRVGNSPLDVHYGIPHPGVVPQGEPQSVYMYFATGPPSKPPQAVYAVYNDYDALPLKANPARMQPLHYGGPVQLPPNGTQYRENGAPQGRYAPSQPLYTAGELPDVLLPSRQTMYDNVGPYGLNLPLGALAAAAPGRLPPYEQPHAYVTSGAIKAEMDPLLQLKGRYYHPEPLSRGGGAEGGVRRRADSEARWQGSVPMTGRPPDPTNQANYGLGAEVAQRDVPYDSYGDEPALSVGDYGLGAEVAKRDVPYDSYGDQPALSVGDYSLGAEVARATVAETGGSYPYFASESGLGSRDAVGSLPRPGLRQNQAYGLQAEALDAMPPAPPALPPALPPVLPPAPPPAQRAAKRGTGPFRSPPSRLRPGAVGHRLDTAAAAPAPALDGEEMFGLSAEGHDQPQDYPRVSGKAPYNKPLPKGIGRRGGTTSLVAGSVGDEEVFGLSAETGDKRY